MKLIDVTNMSSANLDYLMLTLDGKRVVTSEDYSELARISGEMTYQEMKAAQATQSDYEVKELMYDAWCYYNNAGQYNRNRKYSRYLSVGDYEGAILAEQEDNGWTDM